jgi:hybrid polyketide synthase/nonribosomal peptide synthetase ACE1
MASADVRTPLSAAAIVLTGDTGHLGRELLRQLIENGTVREIHCIAVRRHERLRGISNRDHIYTGDLSAPLLGLSPQAASIVFAKADVIIHNGANLSHLKYYRSLKADNVGSTRELVRLAAPRRIPIQFVSTAGGRALLPFIRDKLRFQAWYLAGIRGCFSGRLSSTH